MSGQGMWLSGRLCGLWAEDVANRTTLRAAARERAGRHTLGGLGPPWSTARRVVRLATSPPLANQDLSLYIPNKRIPFYSRSTFLLNPI